MRCVSEKQSSPAGFSCSFASGEVQTNSQVSDQGRRRPLTAAGKGVAHREIGVRLSRPTERYLYRGSRSMAVQGAVASACSPLLTPVQAPRVCPGPCAYAEGRGSHSDPLAPRRPVDLGYCDRSAAARASKVDDKRRAATPRIGRVRRVSRRAARRRRCERSEYGGCGVGTPRPAPTGAERYRRTSRPVRRVLSPPEGGVRPSISACRRRQALAVYPQARAGSPRTPASDLAPGGVYLAAPVTRGAGGLLPHRFTLTRPEGRAVCSLWHCPAGRPGLPLTTTLPFGARTFLGGTGEGADAAARSTRPSC